MPAERTRIDELDRNILTLCTRINVATYELLVMVREFDERAGFLQWGLESCADWLAWRCDLSRTTAREKVRVAHALKVLPRIARAFATGELSYAKVRALTRVATRDNEEALLAFALRHTAVTVAERCRELRCGREDSIGVAERAFAHRALRIRRDHERSLMTVTVELPLDSGELLEKALDKARDDEGGKLPESAETSWSSRQADAFVTLLNDYLSGDVGGSSHSDNHLVVIHVDESALAGGTGRAALPLETVKRHCCDGKAVVITETCDGEPLAIGRKNRVVPQAMERAVRARDHNRCRFPGCHYRRYLACHHVEHWAHGGETGIDNLLLLCSQHHTLVHEGGFRIDKDFRDQWAFFRPDGIGVPEVGYVAEIGSGADAPAGAFLPGPENSVREGPPPAYLH